MVNCMKVLMYILAVTNTCLQLPDHGRIVAYEKEAVFLHDALPSPVLLYSK